MPYEWHLIEHMDIKAARPDHPGLPSVNERPELPAGASHLMTCFNMLMKGGEMDIPALSKMYDVAGIFDELFFYELMHDAKSTLEDERYKVQKEALKNGE